MSDSIKVKWPGANIHEDDTHRLVTDEQIERWDTNPDWEQNDENAAGFIENRPFYDNSISQDVWYGGGNVVNSDFGGTTLDQTLWEMLVNYDSNDIENITIICNDEEFSISSPSEGSYAISYEVTDLGELLVNKTYPKAYVQSPELPDGAEHNDSPVTIKYNNIKYLEEKYLLGHTILPISELNNRFKNNYNPVSYYVNSNGSGMVINLNNIIGDTSEYIFSIPRGYTTTFQYRTYPLPILTTNQPGYYHIIRNDDERTITVTELITRIRCIVTYNELNDFVSKEDISNIDSNNISDYYIQSDWEIDTLSDPRTIINKPFYGKTLSGNVRFCGSGLLNLRADRYKIDVELWEAIISTYTNNIEKITINDGESDYSLSFEKEIEVNVDSSSTKLVDDIQIAFDVNGLANAGYLWMSKLEPYAYVLATNAADDQENANNPALTLKCDYLKQLDEKYIPDTIARSEDLKILPIDRLADFGVDVITGARQDNTILIKSIKFPWNNMNNPSDYLFYICADSENYPGGVEHMFQIYNSDKSGTTGGFGNFFAPTEQTLLFHITKDEINKTLIIYELYHGNAHEYTFDDAGNLVNTYYSSVVLDVDLISKLNSKLASESYTPTESTNVATKGYVDSVFNTQTINISTIDTTIKDGTYNFIDDATDLIVPFAPKLSTMTVITTSGKDYDSETDETSDSGSIVITQRVFDTLKFHDFIRIGDLDTSSNDNEVVWRAWAELAYNVDNTCELEG